LRSELEGIIWCTKELTTANKAMNVARGTIDALRVARYLFFSNTRQGYRCRKTTTLKLAGSFLSAV